MLEMYKGCFKDTKQNKSKHVEKLKKVNLTNTYTEKNVQRFPVPGRDVTNPTLPSRV